MRLLKIEENVNEIAKLEEISGWHSTHKLYKQIMGKCYNIAWGEASYIELLKKLLFGLNIHCRQSYK